MSARLDREASLSLVAAALEQLTGERQQQRATVEALPPNLHQDAVDVLANVDHFIDDADIRAWDERWRRMQEDHLRGLIRSLRDGASREVLLRFDFVNEIPNPSQGEAFRDPSPAEHELLEHLLGGEFPGQPALRAQLHGLQVRRIDESGSLELRVAVRQPARVVDRLPVKAVTSATAATPVHVELHVMDGLLDELHIYREDGKPVDSLPRNSELRVYHPPYKG